MFALALILFLHSHTNVDSKIDAHTHLGILDELVLVLLIPCLKWPFPIDLHSVDDLILVELSNGLGQVVESSFTVDKGREHARFDGGSAQRQDQ